jgi:prophage antirepressor-like protein
MDLRVVEIGGEPWFVVRDVCLALGMYLSPRDSLPIVTVAVRKLGEDEAHLYPIQVEDKLGRKTTRKIMLVSESGLYKLTMRSDKKEAKQFQDWVTREVLPSIRKTGTYTMPGAKKAIEAPSRPRQKTSPHHYKGNHNGHASGHARTKDHIIFKLTLSGRSPQHGCMFWFWVSTTSEWTEREQTPCRTALARLRRWMRCR